MRNPIITYIHKKDFLLLVTTIPPTKTTKETASYLHIYTAINDTRHTFGSSDRRGCGTYIRISSDQSTPPKAL